MADDFEQLAARMSNLEEQMARLMGTHVELSAGTVDPQGHRLEGPHAEVILAEGPPPGESLVDWISRSDGIPGFLVDPGLARATPCIELELAGKAPLVFSRGISGPLDEEQRALYCAEGIEVRGATDTQRQRMTDMEEAAQKCREATRDYSGTSHLDAWMGCMGSELRAKGIEIW